MASTISGVQANPRADGLGYNPRCLRRDVNKNAAAVTTANYTYDLITKNNNIYWFQTVMQGQFQLGQWGVHTGGHYTIGGDPAGVSLTYLTVPSQSGLDINYLKGLLHIAR